MTIAEENLFKWNEEQSVLLLNLIAENKKFVGPMRKFRYNKAMYSHIAEVLTRITDFFPAYLLQNKRRYRLTISSALLIHQYKFTTKML